MVLNNKGQAMVFGLMIAVFVFLAAVAIIAPLKDNIAIARNADNLDCDNSTITTETRATCLIVGLYMPYFIAAVLAGGVGFVFARRVT
jgi:hypothetical protein|tara:strand:+ start:211 stop:474 length:264 start_codon:yes stop_codon:yes gene_type:complete